MRRGCLADAVRPPGGDVVARPADLVEPVEEARARERLEEVEDHLALAEAVEEHRRPAAERPPMSMHHVPSQRQWEAIRWSSAASTRRYCARFGTSICAELLHRATRSRAPRSSRRRSRS